MADVMVPCDTCGGEHPNLCSACRGSGLMPNPAITQMCHRGCFDGRVHKLDDGRTWLDLCPDCEGRGWTFRLSKCFVCDGRGERFCVPWGEDDPPEWEPCDECDGTGLINEKPDEIFDINKIKEQSL